MPRRHRQKCTDPTLADAICPKPQCAPLTVEATADRQTHGAQNNPLHISIFPSHDPTTNTLTPARTPLQFSLLLSSTLDVFDLRARHHTAGGTGLSGDFGLLHAVDERLAAYGFETNTGVRFIVVVDMRGRRIDASVVGGLGAGGAGATGGDAKSGAAAKAAAAAVGLRDGEMKPVSFVPSCNVFRWRTFFICGFVTACWRKFILMYGFAVSPVQVFRAMQTAYIRLLQNPFYEPDEHSPPGGRGGKKITSRRFAADMRRIGEAWTPGVTSL